MSQNSLEGLKAAYLIENGFCEREYSQASTLLQRLNVIGRIISSNVDLVRAWNEEKKTLDSNWGRHYAVDCALNKALASDFDILVLPGGRRSIEKLALNPDIRSFVSGFMKTGKPVVSYNGAAELLIELDLVHGYSVAARGHTCDTIKTVGGRCAAPEFVVSKNLISLTRFRDVDDKMLEALNCILSGEKYVEKVMSSNNMPSAYKAA